MPLASGASRSLHRPPHPPRELEIGANRGQTGKRCQLIYSAMRRKATPVSPVALTDAGFRAGEAPVLGHQVGVVALGGQHLRHLPGPLPLPHLGLQENPEADVPSVRRELPPAGDRAPLTAPCLGSGPLRAQVCVWGAPCLPEHAAREQDLAVHLQGGASAHGRLVVVLHPHVILHVVMPGHVAPVVDLWARAVSGHRPMATPPPSRPLGTGPWSGTWGCHRGQSWSPRTPQAAGRG